MLGGSSSRAVAFQPCRQREERTSIPPILSRCQHIWIHANFQEKPFVCDELVTTRFVRFPASLVHFVLEMDFGEPVRGSASVYKRIY